jgi:hypothetical protein
MALCTNGRFDSDTIATLRAAYKEDGMASAVIITKRFPCAVCGGYAFAENKSSEWVPKSHDRPTKARSDKGSGRKR